MSDQKFDYDRVHSAARAAQHALWAMGAETREVTFNGLTTLDTGRVHGPEDHDPLACRVRWHDVCVVITRADGTTEHTAGWQDIVDTTC